MLPKERRDKEQKDQKAVVVNVEQPEYQDKVDKPDELLV